MNEEQKRAIISEAVSMEYIPQAIERKDVDLSLYDCFGLPELSDLIPELLPMVQGLCAMAPNAAQNGEVLYKAVLPENATHLAHSAKKGGNIGAAMNKNNQVVGQATLKPVTQSSAPRFDAYKMASAAMMMSIDLKLNDIMNSQENIAAFLEQKEQAVLEGNLAFLADIINHYKFNFDNDIYKTNSHVKVLDIKQSSEQSIKLFQIQTKSSLNRKGLFITFNTVKSDINKLLRSLEKYRLAIYMYAFSSYVETLLLENFEREYLDRIIGKIKAYSLEYREVYTECYAKVERAVKNSVESFATRFAAGTVKTFGKVAGDITKNADISKDTLQASEQMLKADEVFVDHTAKVLSSNRTADVSCFVSGLNEINHLFNDPLNLIMAGDKLYIGK